MLAATRLASLYAKVAKLIVSEKATMVVDHVEHHAIDDEYDMTIFTERMPRNASCAMIVKKGIPDYVFPDSEGEAGFARDLDAADEVEVYAKLPRTFAIPTPVATTRRIGLGHRLQAGH